jgi:hypothetical protein
MDADVRARLALTRRVVAMLRSPDFRAALRIDGQDVTDVVVLLADDTVGYVCDRLQAASGCAAVVVAGERTCSLFHVVTRHLHCACDKPPA